MWGDPAGLLLLAIKLLYLIRLAGLATGTRFLAVCDTVGEKLAWWLGITSPKYYYEIQEAIRMKVVCPSVSVPDP
jgi:hypothetical protein